MRHEGKALSRSSHFVNASFTLYEIFTTNFVFNLFSFFIFCMQLPNYNFLNTFSSFISHKCAISAKTFSGGNFN